MKRIYLYGDIFWLSFSIAICIEAYRQDIGTIRYPGPGFFPFCVALVMAGLALIAILQSMGKHEQEEERDHQETFRWWNIVIILAAILVYALVLQTVGFLICTFLFVGILLKVVEPQSWKVSILGGLITAVSAEVVFNVILRSQIPSGFFGF